MNRSPDAATLDALVLGTGDPQDGSAWEALVRHPEGAQAWRKAVAGRQRVDLLASAIRGREWLARVAHHLAVAGRRMGRAPQVEVSILFPDLELDSLAAATLGPAEEHEAAEALNVRWGQIVAVTVRVGVHVALQPSPNPQALDVRYLRAEEQGNLPTRTWKLERGEAPVLLVALLGASLQEPLHEAMLQASGIAGVLLLEDTSQGE